jgi:hypothetical protein
MIDRCKNILEAVVPRIFTRWRWRMDHRVRWKRINWRKKILMRTGRDWRVRWPETYFSVFGPLLGMGTNGDGDKWGSDWKVWGNFPIIYRWSSGRLRVKKKKKTTYIHTKRQIIFTKIPFFSDCTSRGGRRRYGILRYDHVPRIRSRWCTRPHR